MSSVKDTSLAPQGEKQIELAELRMPGLLKIRQRFKKLKRLPVKLAGQTVFQAFQEDFFQAYID